MKVVDYVSVVKIQVSKIGEHVYMMMISKGDSVRVGDSSYL